jgi:hypothetical protein
MLKENESYLQVSTAFPTLARLGVFRLYFDLGGELDFAAMTEPQKAEMKAIWSSPEYFMSQRAEMLAGPGIFSDGQRLGKLGDMPLLVITAGPEAAGAWGELQSELALLSENSIRYNVETATHASLAFDPDDAHQVSIGIAGIVESIRRDVPLEAAFTPAGGLTRP